MGFRLVPKLLTLNDFELCNGRFCIIALKSRHLEANLLHSG